MSRGEVLWNKVISRKENAYVLQCNCGTGEDNVRVYADKGHPKARMIAVDELQRNLDGLKADGFVTMKANVMTSDIVRRLETKRFDVIVFAPADGGWTPNAVSMAVDLPKLLNEDGNYVLVTSRAKDGEALSGDEKNVYSGLLKHFKDVRVVQPKHAEETYFVFGAKKA